MVVCLYLRLCLFRRVCVSPARAPARCPVLVLQENDMLHKQNELLRTSEAAYQREAQLVRGGWYSAACCWRHARVACHTTHMMRG